MRALRIGLAIETTGPGGAETMLLGLAGELREQGHGVVAVVPSGGEAWLFDRFRSGGFTTEEIPLGGPIHRPTIRRLIEIIRDHDLDLLHSHEFTLAVNGAVASRLGGCAHVITMHGGLYFADRLRRRLALRAASALSDSTVAVSHFSRRVVADRLSIAEDGLEVVHNGVSPLLGSADEVRRELGCGVDDVLILAVGNLYPVKGHGFLVDAVGNLLQTSPARVILAIAGRGEQEAVLRAQASALGLDDSVRLLGFRSDIPDLLAAADVFAMPSLSEGLPMAILEAMFAGKAIVASEVGGIPELIQDGVQGILVPASDAGRLTAALRTLVLDGDLRRRMGAAAAERAEGAFSTRAMGARYLDIYRAAVGR